MLQAEVRVDATFGHRFRMPIPPAASTAILRMPALPKDRLDTTNLHSEEKNLPSPLPHFPTSIDKCYS